jgi:hypothetical protein
MRHSPSLEVNARQPLGMALAAALAFGCASGGAAHPEQNPAIVAAVDAQVRIVSSETTWVSRGLGYQIVALSRREIAAVDSSVAHQSKMYNQVFGTLPAEVIVLVTRVNTDPNAYDRNTTPLLPPGTTQQVVDVRLYDDDANNANGQGQNQRARGGYGGIGGGRGGVGGNGGYGGYPGNGARGRAEPPGSLGDPTQAVTRAWLSARATRLTGHTATAGANGQLSDPRVPVWAEALVPALAASDTMIERMATQLAAQPESLYALRDFFTMSLPGTGPRASRAAQGADRGANRAGGMRGGRGRQGGGNAAREGILGGNALFVAQATVFGKYLSLRQGTPLIGQLVDGQIRGKRITDVLAAQPSGPKDVEWLDQDWRDWLRQYAPHQ